MSQHSVSRKIERNIKSKDELDALKKPLEIQKVKTDSLGRPSQRYIGSEAEVVINPQTKRIVSMNPVRANTKKRLIRERSNGKK